MLKKLVKEEWHTDAVAVTDDNGFVNVNAFKGEYEISCDDMKATAVFTDDGNDKIEITVK